MATSKVCSHVSSYSFAKETQFLPEKIAHIRLSVHPSTHLSPCAEAASSLLLAKECEGKKQTKKNKKIAEHSPGKRSRFLVVIHTRSFNVKTEISRWVVQGGGREIEREEEVEEEVGKKSLIWEEDGHPSAISPSLSACPTLNAP